MSEGIEGRYVYLRLGAGKLVQQFRVWDAERFITAQVERGLANKGRDDKPEPYVVQTATEAEYRAQR